MPGRPGMKRLSGIQNQAAAFRVVPRVVVAFSSTTTEEPASAGRERGRAASDPTSDHDNIEFGVPLFGLAAFGRRAAPRRVCAAPCLQHPSMRADLTIVLSFIDISLD